MHFVRSGAVTGHPYMPPSIFQNLPEDVVAIINVVKRYRTEATTPNFDSIAALGDLETHLCDLLRSMISSPITGRIYLQPPAAYVPQDVRDASLHLNLGA